MVVIIIIVLAVVAYWFYMSSEHNKEELVIEKGKLRNFESLIFKLKTIEDPNYTIVNKKEREVMFRKNIGNRTKKLLILETYQEKLGIQYIIYGQSTRENYSKAFSFTIYDSANYIAETVQIGIIAFECELKEKHPNILD